MSRRRSIDLPQFGHTNPIPAASMIGSLLVSGALTGRDPTTREMPATIDEQCANVFAHVRALMSAAGGTTDDIIKMTFRLAEYRDREALNREWLVLFPDARSRPARQVVSAELDDCALVHCDLMAMLPQ